jgi:hypothetical protein
MQIPLLLLIVFSSLHFLGCTPQSPNTSVERASPKTTQPILSQPLKAAIEGLKVLKVKVKKDGKMNQREYEKNLADLVLTVENAYGNPEVLAAVQSVTQGHQLALQFWQCDRVSGYDALYQCRDEVLAGIFAKYPELEAEARLAVEGENLPYLSAGLDEDAILQTIWHYTAEDTDALVRAIEPSANSSAHH